MSSHNTETNGQLVTGSDKNIDTLVTAEDDLSGDNIVVNGVHHLLTDDDKQSKDKHNEEESVTNSDNSDTDSDNNRKLKREEVYEEVSDEEDVISTSNDEDMESSVSINDTHIQTNNLSNFYELNDGQDLDLSTQPFPDTVTVLEGPNGAKVYLVGTAHFSEKSQQDVSHTIRRTKPNIIVLELCESRLSILSFDEKSILEESKTMGIAKIRRNIQEYGLVQGVMYVLLLSLSAHLTKQLGMAPGGEFRRAFNEASRVPGCVVHLGDRPVHITLRRAISSLTVWQKLKLAFGIIFNNESISKEEVEKCKQKDLLEEMLAEMTGEFPALSNVFVNERDTYLAYSLWLAASPIPDMSLPSGSRPATVVGVVGIGHVPGIVKQWGKVTDKEIPPLLKLPETSLTTKIVKKSIKYTFIGLAVWGCYRLLAPTSLNIALSDVSKQTIIWIQKSIKK
ncbi:traB domain-containing protein-like [Oppia nitens]|uniref:traB domain-containing protein-like n=1 Tax=Oppia nitens TaxID=1686743 RepID=UPI0023DB9DF8|nr:traB domain-containing protein-like [Oppia nitens]